MIRVLILVFVGGAFGAIVREFLMLSVPYLFDGFPLSILVANISAAFLLGLATGLHQRHILNDDVNTFIGTGIMGGLSTFSSFVYGSFVLITTSLSDTVVATVYILVSLILGYGALLAGLKITNRDAV